MPVLTIQRRFRRHRSSSALSRSIARHCRRRPAGRPVAHRPVCGCPPRLPSSRQCLELIGILYVCLIEDQYDTPTPSCSSVASRCLVCGMKSDLWNRGTPPRGGDDAGVPAAARRRSVAQVDHAVPVDVQTGQGGAWRRPCGDHPTARSRTHQPTRATTSLRRARQVQRLRGKQLAEVRVNPIAASLSLLAPPVRWCPGRCRAQGRVGGA